VTQAGDAPGIGEEALIDEVHQRRASTQLSKQNGLPSPEPGVDRQTG
jgi:hypothetical protein